MGDSKKVPLNESYNYLKKSYDNLNNQQSSTEKAPRLFPNLNRPTNTNQSGNITNSSNSNKKC